jgi:DNA polymerase III delta prime subunit
MRGQSVDPPKAAGGGKPKDFAKKAVLLSGPPGIGKTSSALIVARSARQNKPAKTGCACCMHLLLRLKLRRLQVTPAIMWAALPSRASTS